MTWIFELVFEFVADTMFGSAKRRWGWPGFVGVALLLFGVPAAALAWLIHAGY